MQELPSYPHSWASLLWLLLASFLGGGGTAVVIKLYSLYLNRHKPTAEIHESRARTLKVYAEAEGLDVQSNTAKFDLISRMMTRVDEADETVNRLRKERNSLRDAVDKSRIEMEFDDLQMERMKAFIKMIGMWDKYVEYSDVSRDK